MRAVSPRSWRSPLTVLSLAAVNFFTTLSFAAALSPRDFGVVAAVAVGATLLSSAVRAVLGEQMLADATEADRSGLTSFALGFTFLLVALSLTISLSLNVGGIFFSTLPFLLLAAADPIRYVRLSNEDSLSIYALPGVDALRAALAFATWAYAQSGGALVGVQSALLAVGLLGYITNWRGVSTSAASVYLRSKGSFEKLILLQFALSIALGQALPLLAIHAFGAASFGHIRLAQTFVSPATTVSSAFQPGLIRNLGRTEASHQTRSLVRLTALMLVGGIAVLLALNFLVRLGAFGEGPATELVVAASVGVAATIVGQPGGALIRVRRYGAISLAGQAAGGSVGLLFALLTYDKGLLAFAWGLAGYSVATVAITYLLLLRKIRRTE